MGKAAVAAACGAHGPCSSLPSVPAALSVQASKAGFQGPPCTAARVSAMTPTTPVQILIDKCLGRRVCKHCKRNYNVAEINIPAAPGQPAIYMPPLTAPPECEAHLMQRADDNLDTVLHRLQVGRDLGS